MDQRKLTTFQRLNRIESFSFLEIRFLSNLVTGEKFFYQTDQNEVLNNRLIVCSN